MKVKVATSWRLTFHPATGDGGNARLPPMETLLSPYPYGRYICGSIIDPEDGNGLHESDGVDFRPREIGGWVDFRPRDVRKSTP